ncbi:MAG: fused DSP-PTPase phosphatase/NAD kinase-like protein [Blastocatellia bacterium]
MVIVLACAVMLPVFADKDRKSEAARGNAAVTIENFGRINGHIYRGAQPKRDQYRQLAAIGVKTVLDLRGDAERDSRAEAEGAGLRYLNLPLSPKRYPTADAAARFLEIVNDQANWPLYVHCAGGRHRTGAMIAVYRMTVDHWTVDQAYKEMKQYDFYTFGGHGCYKEYVFDYSRNLSKQPDRQIEATPEVQPGGKNRGSD